MGFTQMLGFRPNKSLSLGITCSPDPLLLKAFSNTYQLFATPVGSGTIVQPRTGFVCYGRVCCAVPPSQHQKLRDAFGQSDSRSTGKVHNSQNLTGKGAIQDRGPWVVCKPSFQTYHGRFEPVSVSARDCSEEKAAR